MEMAMNNFKELLRDLGFVICLAIITPFVWLAERIRWRAK